MAKIIKGKDLIDSTNVTKTISDLIKELKGVEKALLEVANNGKKTNTELVTLNKTQQNLSESTKKFQSQSDKLTEIEKERIRLTNNLSKAISTNSQKNTELKVQLQQQNKANKDLAREKLGLIGAYEKESKKLTALRIKYKNAAVQYGENSKQAKKLKDEVVKLDSKLKKIDSTVGQNQRNVGNYASTMSGLPGILGRVGSATQMLGTAMKTVLANPIFLVIGAVAGLAKGLSSLIKGAKTYQKANAELASVLGVTRKQIKNLQDSSKSLASTTAFTAEEVVALQTEYAKLGFSQKEIIGLSKASIDLSVAAKAGTDEVAGYIGAVVKTFGLSAEEATRIADVTAKAASSSALSFEKLSVAMPIVGATAKNAGVDVEELTAQLGILADRGIDASTSATALRNIFLELAKRGITYEQAMSKINNSTNKNATAMELFGKRGATVASILSENTKEVKELEKTLLGAGGAVEKMANEQLNTLEGKSKLMKSAWDGLKKTLADGEGIITKVAEGAVVLLTKAINILQKTIVGTKKFFTDFYNESIVFRGILQGLGLAIKTNFEIISTGFKEIINSAKTMGRVFKAIATGNFGQIGSIIKEGFQNGKQIIVDSAKNIADDAKTAFENTMNPKIKVEADTEGFEEEVKTEINKIESSNAVKVPVELIQKPSEVAAGIKSDEAKSSTSVIDFEIADFDEELKARLASEESSLDASLARQQEMRDEAREEELEKYKEFLEAKTEADAEAEEIKGEIINELRESALGIANDIFVSYQEAELAESQAKADREIAILDRQLKNGEITQLQYDKKRQRIEKQQMKEAAQAQKNAAIFNAVINAAAAAVASLAQYPLPAGAGALAANLALGAIQIAAVAAQPLPQYKHGVKDKPTSGLSIIGDGGMSELIRLPDGNEFLSPATSTLAYLPQHTEVLDGYKTRDLISSEDINNNNVKMLIESNNRVENAIKNLDLRTTNITDRGFFTTVEKSNCKLTELDNFFD